MQKSAYNIIVPVSDSKNVLFNAMTKKFFYISKHNTAACLFMLNNIESFLSDEAKDFVEKLYDNGFVIDDDRDELSELKSLFYEYKNNKVLNLMILTTYSCNFSCWYCVQKHKGIILSKELERKIERHIESYIKENSIEHLTLSWFGGEPLLNVGSICRISEFAIDFCAKNAIGFNNAITTNGSLLTASLIQTMKKLSFNNFQITIDGEQANHNKTRFNDKIQDSFSLILQNIVMLAKMIPEADITCRINYTRNNLTDNFPEEIDAFLHPVKDGITLLFRKVWQENETSIMDDKLAEIIRALHHKGYRILSDYDEIKLSVCYVECCNHHSIYPDGRVDRCSNKDIYDARGYLTDKGKIVWNTIPTECDSNVFTRMGDCLSCQYLPLCMGPCPETRRHLGENEKLKCVFEDKDAHFQNDIRCYCITKEDK